VRGKARIVSEILKKLEDTFSKGEIKASLADYIRLVQLQKELEEDEPRDIKVTWIEPGEARSESEG
jgi:hypothetical protein